MNLNFFFQVPDKFSDEYESNKFRPSAGHDKKFGRLVDERKRSEFDPFDGRSAIPNLLHFNDRRVLRGNDKKFGQ